uniref:SMC hinge domain-containing protein n=1 Tax=Phytophthora ramorum TaxID=164328 RepID=H3GIM1_PHYRM
LFQVQDDIKQREETVHHYQEAGQTCEEKEDTVAQIYHEKKKELSASLREVKANRERIQDFQNEMEDIQPQMIQLREQTRYSQKKIVEAETTEKTMKRRLDGKSTEVDALKSDLQELERAKAELDAKRVSQGGGEAALVLEGSRLEEYHRIKEDVQVKTNLLRNELESILRQQTADQNKVQTLAQDRQENLKMVEVLTEDLKQANARIISMQHVISQTERDIADTEKSLQTTDEDNRGQAQKKEKLSQQLERVNNKLRDLKDDKRQSQADARKAEILETLKRLYPGVRGRLVDLCKPTQRKYNMAVTVATGKHMDAIVVTDYRTGQDCIQYLRDSRAGSAQFIPLDKIRVKPINERFRGLGNNIKLVVDVIDCDAEIEPALHYAVGDTVVCASIDVARDLCFRQNEKVKAVTLDGMVVSKNGSMTGGKTQNDLRRAGRWDEKEAEALQQQKDALVDELRALERHGASYAKLQTLRTQLEGLKSRLSHAKADLVITETKRPNIQARMDDAKKRVAEVIDPELHKFETTVGSRKGKIAALEEQIHSVEDEMFAEFSESIGVESIRVYEEKVLKRQHQATEMRRKITEHEAKLRAQIEYLQSQDFNQPMLDAKERAAREEQHLKQLAEEEAGLTKKVGALRKKRKEQEELRKNLSTKVEELEKELREIGSKKDKYEERKGKIQRRIAAEETVLERLKDHKAEIFRRASLDQITLPTIARKANNSSEDVDREGASSLENAELLLEDDAADQEVDFSALPDAHVVVDDKEFDDINRNYEERIGVLLTELDRMQPNMRALDKFDVIQNRIGKEEEELDRIKQQSFETASNFEKVKLARYERFMEAFNHISGVIDSTYKQLTKSSKHPLGGTAYLNLENTDEPYLNGMKYNAMPPMKRFREMEHLSGGEKTVAALALLFAIHNYRPSPFFVLDEVDAALDNVNVNKVSTYIANCTFQCVVISLKDSFYEKADALVGICKDITLQQSKSMTLDLTKFD